MASRDEFVIAQVSDVHFGEKRHDPKLAARCLEMIRDAKPDVVLVAGDLTASGYPEEYAQAADFVHQLPEPWFSVPGNHDERNVGWRSYERLFGPRWNTHDIPFGVPSHQDACSTMRLVACDSAEPDLDDGELGRVRHQWIRDSFGDDSDTFRIVMLHHHLVSVPNTGRERNVVSDAGDVLETLALANVDLVLSGHKHVPYVWVVNGTPLITSGTATTWRIRGEIPPSFNLLRVTPEWIHVTFVPTPSGAKSVTMDLPRRPLKTLAEEAEDRAARDVAAFVSR